MDPNKELVREIKMLREAIKAATKGLKDIKRTLDSAIGVNHNMQDEFDALYFNGENAMNEMPENCTAIKSGKEIVAVIKDDDEQQLNLYDAMAQAVRDAKDDEIPAVFHRKNHCESLVTMRMDDWFELYREWEAGQ